MNGPKFRIGTTVILFNERLDKILMLKRDSSKKLAPSVWANVGGKLDRYEMTLDSAVREIYEETGFRVSKKSLRFVTYFERVGQAILLVFAARIKERKPRLSDEHSCAEWFSIKKLPKERIKDPVMEAKKVLLNSGMDVPFRIKK